MLQLITTHEDVQSFINDAVQRAHQNLPVVVTGTQSVEIINGATLMERLDISEPTLIRWRQKGKIPFMQIGSAVRYDWYKVLDALEVKKQKRS